MHNRGLPYYKARRFRYLLSRRFLYSIEKLFFFPFRFVTVNMDIKGIEDIGCYKDTPERAIPLLEAISPMLGGSYMQRAAAIRRCAKAAYDLQLDIFAVQNGGQCFGGPRAKVRFNKYGTSTQCPGNGRGGPWANQVYRITSK